jgi:hypothetical protein
MTAELELGLAEGFKDTDAVVTSTRIRLGRMGQTDRSDT